MAGWGKHLWRTRKGETVCRDKWDRASMGGRESTYASHYLEWRWCWWLHLSPWRNGLRRDFCPDISLSHSLPRLKDDDESHDLLCFSRFLLETGVRGCPTEEDQAKDSRTGYTRCEWHSLSPQDMWSKTRNCPFEFFVVFQPSAGSSGESVSVSPLWHTIWVHDLLSRPSSLFYEFTNFLHSPGMDSPNPLSTFVCILIFFRGKAKKVVFLFLRELSTLFAGRKSCLVCLLLLPSLEYQSMSTTYFSG